MSEIAPEHAEALFASIQSDKGVAPPAETPPAAEPAPPAPEQQESAPPPAEDQDALTLKALMESLPEEYRGNVNTYLTARERAMQGDYTRKTQALADERKQMESDLAFLDSLRTDPTVAMEFHRELTDALIEAGFTPGEAQAIAEETAAEAQEVATGDNPDDALQARLSALETRLAEQDQRAEQEAYERQVKDLESQYQLQEAEIRQAHPSYKDEDIEDIYSIAFSLDGDLHAANQRYQAILQRQIGGYVEQKQELETQPDPQATGGAVTPKTFESVEEAHAAAEEALRNFLGGQ